MKHLITFALSFITLFSYAQDYYWVGGTGNWSDYANHWATSSGGTTFHTTAPTSTDNVYFDANSFSTSGQVVTIDVEANCLSMDWTGVTNFPSITTNSVAINIYGSLTMSADMSADFYTMRFQSAAAGNTITSNGTSLGTSSNVQLTGSGEWTLTDNFVSDRFSLTNGTFNTSNNAMTVDRWTMAGSSNIILNMGSSVITCTNSFFNQAYNLTVDAGTSTVVTAQFYPDDNSVGGYNWNDVELSGSNCVIGSGGSIANLSIAAGAYVTFANSETIAINSLTAIGSKHAMITMKSNLDGSQASISQLVGSVTVDYVILQDINATGGASFTANNTIDQGNNAGWTINTLTGLDYYWVNDGGSWTDFANHWATTSGGSTMHTDYPGRLDNVFFDANSFSVSGQTVLNDLDNGAYFNNMDWTGVTNMPTIDAPYSFPLYAYGSVTFTDGVDKDIHNLNLYGEGTVNFYASTGTGRLSYLAVYGSGTYYMHDDLDLASITLNGQGIVHFNDIAVTLAYDFNLYDANELYLGASTISGRSMLNYATGLTLDAGTSSLSFTSNFDGGGYAYNNVTLDGTGTISDDNTFAQLEITPGSSIDITNGSNQTITGNLILTGTKAAPITLSSSVGGSQATITKISGTVDAIYLVMQDLIATGGATFNATQTIDNGNNTGWNITGLTGQDYYWVGNGGNWSDFANHWATTSGGSTMHTTEPGVLDNVIFDANSFSIADQTVTVDTDEISFNDMNWTGVANNPLLSASAKTLNVYGSLVFDPNMTINVTTCNFLSNDVETINTAGFFVTTMDFTGTGSWTFQSAISVRNLNHHSGAIDFNNQTVDVSFSTSFFGTDTKSMTLGTSSYFTRLFQIGSASNLTFDGSSSSITSSSSFSITGGSSNTFSFNDFTFMVANSTDEGVFGTDMTFNTLTFTEGTIIELLSGITITVNNLVATGTSASPIEIRTYGTAGTPATISQATGTVDGDYLILQNITATGGATFNAYNSINNGNVTGWIFHKFDQTIDFPAIADKTYGDADFDLTATASSGLAVVYSIVSGPATLSGSTVTITGTGTVQVKAEQAGDVDYNPAPSVINEFTVLKADQTITFDALAAKTFGDPTFELTATASSGLPVTYASSDETVATISGSTVTIVGQGTTTITASQVGDTNYNAAVDATQELVVGKADQTITFDALASKTFGDAAFELVATASSGLAVTFASSDETIATISGTTVSIVGAGTVTITASQLGDADYNAAVEVTQELVVGKADQTITFDALAGKTFGDAAFDLVATASSELAVTFASSDETIATISGTTVTIVGAGTVNITASQAGNGNYNPAVEVIQELIVAKADQAITFEVLADYDLDTQSGSIALNATASSGLTVSYDVSGPAVLDGNSLTPTGPGVVTVTATQAGNANYNAAAEVVQSFNVTGTALGLFDDAEIYFYPNPTKDFLYFSSSVKSFKIVNLDGKTILISTATKSAVDLSQINSGTYIIQTIGSNNSVTTSRLIVE